MTDAYDRLCVLLDTLDSLDVRLTSDGKRIHWEGDVSDELAQRIEDYKLELLELLVVTKPKKKRK